MTHVTFDVQRVVFARSPATVEEQITLTFAGGRVEDGEFHVCGVPEFEVGQEVVTFAFHDGRRFIDPIVGGSQGLFRVVRDPVTGTAYPLAVGRHGVERLFKGNLVATDTVATIVAGAVTFEAPRLPEGTTVMPPPTPVTGGVPAAMTTAAPKSRPETILDVETFCDEVAKAWREMPANRK